MYHSVTEYTLESIVRTNIEIDDALMAEARRLCGGASKKATVEEALRLLVRLRRQGEFRSAFGRYQWEGDLETSREGRGTP